MEKRGRYIINILTNNINGKSYITRRSKDMKIKIFIVMFLSFFMLLGLNVNAYGYGYQKNGNHEQPNIGKYQQEIEGTNSYYVGNNEDKTLYLTFDAGYDNGNLSRILDVLKEKDVKATFFVTGDFVNRESELLKRIVSEGHIVGNHTYHHKNITKLDRAKIEEELNLLNDKYKEIIGTDIPRYFRPPEGQFDHKSLLDVKELGYTTFFWSVAYDDWNTNNQKGINYAYNKIMDNLHNGAIILLHTVSSDNANVLGKVIDDSRKLGYEFKNLDQFN